MVEKRPLSRFGKCLPAALLICATLQAQPPVQFDAERAFADLVYQCDLGPRYPNSPGAERMATWLHRLLQSQCDTVIVQPFTLADPYHPGRKLKLRNFIGRFRPRLRQRVIIGAHWDTRPHADQDPLEPQAPLLGANDGASGVAVLVELARQLHKVPPPLGVDLIFFDGEDYGREGDLQHYFLGSRYYVQHPLLPKAQRMILLDMVGDAQLTIPIEANSYAQAPELVNSLWSIAAQLDATAFVSRLGPEVLDDHIPFIQAGYQAVDLIDLAYPDESNAYWHTLQDTPDKCAAASLEQVGRVVLTWIYQQKQDSQP